MFESNPFSNQTVINIRGEPVPEFYFREIQIALPLFVICIAGLVGNGFSLVIFSRPRHKSSIDSVFLSLAVADALYLVVTLIFSIIPSLLIICNAWDSSIHKELLKQYPLYSFLANCFGAAAFLFISELSVERYIAVCHPFKSLYLCTQKNARICVCIISAVCVAWASKFYFGVEVTLVSNGHNMTHSLYSVEMYEVRKSAIHKSSLGFAIGLLGAVTLVAIPVLTIAYCNIRIFMKVLDMNRKRKAMMIKSNTENTQITRMFIGVVIAFTICFAFSFVYMFHKSRITYALYRCAFVLNSTINFPIYVLSGSKFRQEVVNLIQPCLAYFMRSQSKAESKPEGSLIQYDWKLGNVNTYSE